MYEKSGWKFNKEVSDVFDQHVRQSVPCYEYIQNLVSNLSDFYIEQNSLIYDIGCSTGETIFNINARHLSKNLRFIGIDNSNEMLKKAKDKLEENKNIQLINGNIEEFIPMEKSNLIISILVMQFLSKEQRKIVVKRLYNTLYEGGAFILVEKVYANYGKTQEIFTQMYHDFKEQQGLCIEEIYNKDNSLRGVMLPMTVNENIEILNQAGFTKIEEFFKTLNFIGVLAIK